MPTYSYACSECGHAFDIVQSFSDDSLTVCPTCGGRLRKVYNAVGVVFKGSGFYRTDSRSGGSTGSSGSKSKPAETSTSGSTTSPSSTSSSSSSTSSSSSSSSSSGSGSSSTSTGSSAS